MNANEGRMQQRRFWDIPSAALQAGYSSRHFRRIIEEEGIPVMRIGRKFFILGRDLENWQMTHRDKQQEPTERAIS
jgi:hypothetical protein